MCRTSSPRYSVQSLHTSSKSGEARTNELCFRFFLPCPLKGSLSTGICFVHSRLLQSSSCFCLFCDRPFLCLLLVLVSDRELGHLTEMDELIFYACSSLTSFLKCAERRVAVVASFVFQAVPSSCDSEKEVDHLFLKGLFLLLTSGFGESCGVLADLTSVVVHILSPFLCSGHRA